MELGEVLGGARSIQDSGRKVQRTKRRERKNEAGPQLWTVSGHVVPTFEELS